MKKITLILLLLTLSAGNVYAKDKKDQFSLTRDVLMKTDNCVVLRLRIVAPPTEKFQMTRIVFSYRSAPNTTKEISNDIKNGIWPRGSEDRHAEILLVAQAAKGTKKHPPMLMLSTQQQSPGGKPGAQSFQAHRLSKDMELDDVFKIDVKTGSYPLGKQIKIGTLGVDPVYLSIESDRANKGVERTP